MTSTTDNPSSSYLTSFGENATVVGLSSSFTGLVSAASQSSIGVASKSVTTTAAGATATSSGGSVAAPQPIGTMYFVASLVAILLERYI